MKSPFSKNRQISFAYRSYPVNFWDVFGRNTDYALDPEECMADNFSYAMTYGLTGRDYENPEIIEKILDSVKK